MNKRILVTGATGFLGKNLLDRLSGDSDYTVFAERFDLTKSDEVFSYIHAAKPDIVYHLGALVDLTRSFEIARKTITANVIGTTNLLSALSKHPVEKFIFASTEEVYGEGKLPYKEGNLESPPSPYAVTKLTCEHLIRLYAPQIARQCLVLRIGTMYGPHQPDHRFIYQMIQRALHNEDIPLTSGTSKRDYVYVSDIVEALLLALEVKNIRQFERINLGGGQSATLKDLASAIVKTAGSSSRLRLGAIPDRIGEAKEWLLDNQKAKEILGWEPKIDLESGIKKTIEYYRNN